MNLLSCPACSLDDVLSHHDKWECATCGHEWPKDAAPDAARVVKDAHGNVLADGDSVVLIKDLKLSGGSGALKGGTNAKNIRLVDGRPRDRLQDRRRRGGPQGMLREERLSRVVSIPPSEVLPQSLKPSFFQSMSPGQIPVAAAKSIAATGT